MSTVQMRRFSSGSDFFIKLLKLFTGPTFIMTFLKVDKKFREKIFLTVAMANNCHG